MHGYWLTKPMPTKIRCKAYTVPYPDGKFRATFEPGTYLGPVETVLEDDKYIAILVGGWWINVQLKDPSIGTPTKFAFPVPQKTVNEWRSLGWRDQCQW